MEDLNQIQNNTDNGKVKEITIPKAAMVKDTPCWIGKVMAPLAKDQLIISLMITLPIRPTGGVGYVNSIFQI